MKFIHLEQVSGSEYHLAAIAAWVETAQAGHGDGRSLSINWDDRISVALDEAGALISLCAWRHVKWMQSATVVQGWTDPGHRCNGFYRMLCEEVAVQAKILGCRFMDGGISRRNAAMIASAVSQGRIATGVWMEKKL